MEAPEGGGFYLRYYVGHKGRFGHEFMEFEVRPDGRFRYANGSQYKGDGMIRKEARVHLAVVEEVKRIIRESAILKADDSLWPEPDRVGRQELEVVLDGEHICFTCSKLGSQAEIEATQDPEGCVPPPPQLLCTRAERTWCACPFHCFRFLAPAHHHTLTSPHTQNTTTPRPPGSRAFTSWRRT